MKKNDIGKFSYLVVDDDDLSRDVIGATLARIGATQVLFAEDAKTAFRMVQQHRPDFILLDMAMPDLSGAETFHLLKKEDSQVQVVLCSGVVDEATRAELSAAGIRGFLQKPYRLADLAAMLDLTRTPETLS